ncbi:2-amino-4-hydroxy-6-hydroxymethyldihydropteridinepyrophosphokinase [Candidatus Filomicrobium marinum]|uniref:2-amino-4-hydroxy-6-hydroxymethyldihydropteridine pyrophosphokinase n=2 Tax=Filomicrobium TaxID=119044 RepID=A0A0D6JAV1_9HYPH|nr:MULTISPECIES: 2-amino-4-hydroxy-6-hydroxymethyldihydropteridine diphosphokinase [Filomicrobium]CFX04149.1 2-amino-4-hydroxy-6-hydroxymethyldihydropteridinepyrophosphokinase [Candidatus Filomicrobium marinum]CPR15984.1 2-amino-4-hydroxy-6-hydroxymethyldihydropteridinepyrophosphokinase [Candidatus Filomicrobium marinum]SDP43299.1 2-amino-4-hydroxy-6-hydroxymethyldihydropteridinediphosphokinase [Filomicrobium insigne]
MNRDDGHAPAFDAIVALGSNIGDKVGNIERALSLIAKSGDVQLVKRSRNYRTPPWGKTDQDWFVNACVSVTTELSPHGLLRRCLEVETQMGRERSEKWGPRVIDLDVLVYRGVEMSDKELVLPHPHITQRAFVLAPLADVAADMELNGRTIEEWLHDIDAEGVTPLA